MATRYSDADIELHVSDLTEGWYPTDGIDIGASNTNAARLIQTALANAFPGYSVAVFGGQTQYHAFEVAALPWDEAIDEEAIIAVAEGAVADPYAWVVEMAQA